MTVSVEQLSWETLDYWKASGLNYCQVHSSVFVSRKEDGEINGLGCLGAAPLARAVVLSPLIASSGIVALSLVNELEKVLSAVGIFRYSFYLNETTSEEWTVQVKEMTELGIFQHLGTSETGAHWYERHMIPLDQMVVN